MRTARPLGRALAGAGLVLLLGACAGRGALPPRPAPELLPPASPLRSTSLADADAWLRHHLMEGDFDAALHLLSRSSKAAPRDELHRRLQLGVVLHAAGRYAESNEALEWAEREAEERYTRSVTRAVGSLVVNDGVLAFVPTPPERAMVPYYRMLNYLALGDMQEALVEARRAGALLAGREPKDGCGGEPFLEYLSGLVFQAAGERNDALVSLRRAEAEFGACAAKEEIAPPPLLGADLVRAARDAGVRAVADSAARRYGVPSTTADAGDLVVVVEHGWVAHRAHRDLHVPLFPEEAEALEGSEGEGFEAAAARVSTRLLENALQEAAWGHSYDDHPVSQWAAAMEGAHVLKLSWPAYRRDAVRAAEARVRVDDTVVVAPVVEDVSGSVVRAFDGTRPLVLTRAVARSFTRYVAARELEKKAEEKGGEVAAFVAGRLANLAGNALERADLRSWSLLPDRISVARLSLPPGEHTVRVEVRSPDGGVEVVEVGRVTVPPRGRVFRSVRVWESGSSGFAARE